MSSIVYVPRVPSIVNRMYARALTRRSPFVDSPSKGQVHFFRGVRQAEKKNFLNERYSIGPHDENPLLCGFHHAEVFGWWFDPQVHKREIGDDDVFWEAAVNLTPDHLDLKSKIKMIRAFSLSPSKKWYGHLGEDWAKAYALSQTDPIIVSLLDAEDILLGLRFAIRESTKGVVMGRYLSGGTDENYIDINTSDFIDIFDYLEKENILENVISIRDNIASDDFLKSFFLLAKTLKSTPFNGNMTDLIPGVIMLAFVPVPKVSGQADMNMGNFYSAMRAINDINPRTLKRRSLEAGFRDPLFFIFVNCCRSYMEVEEDIYRFEF